VISLNRLSGKNAIVTGATSGIGESIARRFSEEGANVAIAGRRREKGERVVKGIQERGDKSFFVMTDVTDSKSVAEMYKICLERFHGATSILVNNAGLSTGNAPMEQVPEENWDRVMDTNAKGTFLCSKAVIPDMAKNKGGSIINVSSSAAMRGYVGGTAYSASKAAVVMLTKIIALEHGRDNIRANCICPGSTHSEMFDGSIQHFAQRMKPQGGQTSSAEQIIQNIAKGIPLGRIGEPEDVANLALFLSSEEASFINGAMMVIDGGQGL
jgi:NAD(P)-dependent dehydrogenase (short-subunit alcohol dehydrogenase family)